MGHVRARHRCNERVSLPPVQLTTCGTAKSIAWPGEAPVGADAKFVIDLVDGRFVPDDLTVFFRQHAVYS